MAGVPPLKNSAYTFDVCLVSQADTDVFKTSVTLAAGDIQISKDGGAFANITTLPTEISTSGVLPVALTATEMNADRIAVRFHDAAGDEWQDLLVTIDTETVQINDLATASALATVDGIVDDILVDTGTTIPGTITTIDNEIAVIDGIVDAILVDTGTDIPAALTTIDNFLDTEIAAILEDTGTTLPATLTTIEGKIDTVDNFLDTEVAAILEDTGTTLPASLTAIQADLDNPDQYKADVSALATAAALATVDGIVDSILVDTDTTIPGLIAALNNLSAAQVNAEVVDVLRTDLIPDSYSTDGDQPTIAQAILAIHQFLYDRAVSGTTMTVYKPDGTTAAILLTLDDATSPTSYSRSA